MFIGVVALVSISTYTPAMDKLAISTSAICAVHCLCLPLLLSFFPALGATFFGDEAFHVMLLWVVIPLSLVALTLGCRAHKDRGVVFFGLAGLTALILAATLGHSLLGKGGELIATLIGATAIAAGHVRNYTLCRSKSCSS